MALLDMFHELFEAIKAFQHVSLQSVFFTIECLFCPVTVGTRPTSTVWSGPHRLAFVAAFQKKLQHSRSTKTLQKGMRIPKKCYSAIGMIPNRINTLCVYTGRSWAYQGVDARTSCPSCQCRSQSASSKSCVNQGDHWSYTFIWYLFFAHTKNYNIIIIIGTCVYLFFNFFYEGGEVHRCW